MPGTARKDNTRERKTRTMTNAEAVMEKIQKKIEANPDLVDKVKAVFQFDITGDGGGQWWVDLQNKPGAMGKGEKKEATCFSTMDAGDFVGMASKTVNPVKLFMTGKLKIGGDAAAAMKIQNILA